MRIASALRKGILSGEFKPGQKLSLTDLVDLFGGFRTPIREALQMLEAEGLVEHTINKEATVSLIDEKFIADTYDVRLLLEKEAVRKCANNPAFDSTELLKKQNDAELHASAFTNEQYIAYDLFFHSEIWRQAGNQKMVYFLEKLWIGPYINTNDVKEILWKEAIREHRTILDGIISHEEEKAIGALIVQVTRSKTRLISAIANMHAVQNNQGNIHAKLQ